MSTGANASLLYQPFTSYSRHSTALLHRRWTPPPSSKPVRLKKATGTGTVVCSSSAAPGTEPSIDSMLSELEQGSEQPKRRPAQLSRSRTFTVQESELVAGKVLSGRVKGIMTFGAFIDLGARIDGLLHISKMGEGFVRNVEDVVKVGQQVEVEIMEADIPNRRVKLKLHNPAPAAAPPAAGGAAARGPSSTAAGRETFRGKIAGRGSQQQASRTGATAAKAKSNYQKGQQVNGVVKNLTRRGCFVQLPGDEEGFLHANEISEVGDTAPIDTLVKVGQEVKVKVLRFVDGRLILSMKEEVDLQKVNEQFNENLVATNPFELAFRKSAVLRKYLEETGKLASKDVQVLAKKEEEEADVGETEAAGKLAEVEEESGSPVEARTAELEGEEVVKEDEADVGEAEKAGKLGEVEEESGAVVEARTSELGAEEGKDVLAKKEEEADVGQAEKADKLDEGEERSGAAVEAETAQGTEEADDKAAEEDQVAEHISNGAPSVDAVNQSGISAALVKQLREQSGAGMMDCKKALVETGGDMEKAVEYLRKKGLAGADKKASRIAAEGAIGSYVHDSRIGVLLEVNSETDFVARGEIFMQLVEDLGMQVAASQQVEYVSIEDVPDEVKTREMEIEMQREDLQNKPEAIRGKIVEGRVTKRLGELSLLEQPFIKNDSIIVKDLVKQTIASVGENIQVRRFTRYVLGEGLEKRTHDLAAEVAAQTKVQEEKREAENDEKQEEETAPAPAPAPAGPAVSAGQVKQLRDETGAGMMDCKKALTETQGDLEKAREFLRKKGLASAEKKAGRVAAEGLVVSYVHTGRIGVLLEVNCETDFVARNAVFKELADDLAMQVVACPAVEYVSVDDVPEEVKQKEREIEMQREDLTSKPEQIRGKIVEGRLTKLLAEKALLEQPYLKDDSVLIKDLVSKTAGSLGENIKVRRFVRYTLGEGIQKRSQSFAQEVAAQVKAA